MGIDTKRCPVNSIHNHIRINLSVDTLSHLTNMTEAGDLDKDKVRVWERNIKELETLGANLSIINEYKSCYRHYLNKLMDINID